MSVTGQDIVCHMCIASLMGDRSERL